MKDRRFSIPLLVALAACTSGASGWSSDVCGCIDAWFSLAHDLELSDVRDANDLTLPVVQSAAEKFVGQQLNVKALPGTRDSCSRTPKGATCQWQIWERDGSYKGYIADFHVSGTGKITAVSVRDHTWDAVSGA